MATFKAIIKKNKMKSDKTWHVYILFSHKSQNAYIPTTMFVTQKDLTASFKIKNRSILDRCEDIIRHYREKIGKLNLELNDIEFKSIVNFIKSKNTNTDLSFTEYADKWLSESTIKGIKNYRTAVNSFKRFFGRDNIFFSEVTSQKMKEFAESLSDRPRSQSLYTNAIVKIFNDARNFYNDEDTDTIRIRHTLKKFNAPKQNVAEKRALAIEQIRAIFNLPYHNKTNKGYTCRHDLAKDCFMLSFCLMGMNSADMFYCGSEEGESYKDGFITYYRRKTKDRRNDKAKISVFVYPVIQKIFEKYRGKKRIFNFYERFSTMADLNKSINIGLKEIGRELNIDNLQFYSARHSFATICANDVKIDRYTINLMLNHTDNSMKVTELYIREDFSIINEANFRLIDYIVKML